MSEVVMRALAQMTPREVHDLMKLRIDVFVVEQNCPYPELDGRDVEPATRHAWLARDGAIAAVLRVLDDDTQWRIGRVATARDARGVGLAAELMRAAIDYCAGRDIVLDAQSHLADWYASFGFVVDGADFVEDGIPHTPMRRSMAATSGK